MFDLLDIRVGVILCERARSLRHGTALAGVSAVPVTIICPACAVSIAQSTAQLTLCDFAVRCGGEAILVVMPTTDVDTANDWIDHLRRVFDAKTSRLRSFT